MRSPNWKPWDAPKSTSMWHKSSCHLVNAITHHTGSHQDSTPTNRELLCKATLVIIGGGEIQIYLFQNVACRSTERQLSSVCHRWSHACLTHGFIRLVVCDSRIFPTHSHQESRWIFGGRLKKETTLWQGLGSLWMQMSLGKFTEQLAGSKSPASTTSPPTRHNPHFARRSKGFTGAQQQEHTLIEKGMEILWLTRTASAAGDYYFVPKR